jgi:uncharacterized protein YraI
MTLSWTMMRGVMCAAALVVVSADLAAAAPARVASNTNLREGPGTEHGIVATVPGGNIVNVINCSGEWCNVTWRGRAGYLISRNLAHGTAATVVRRPVAVVGQPVVVQPAPVVVYGAPYYYGPRVYVGPRYHWRRW